MVTSRRQCRREAFRQDELLPMREEFLTPEQFSAEMNRTGIVSQHAGLAQELINSEGLSTDYGGSHASPEMAAALGTLELKLNYLIAMSQEQANSDEYDQRLVNLSATGIGFTTHEKCSKGDRLKIMINLPLFPPVQLELLGEVVSVSPSDSRQGGTRIGISFIYRCEQEESAIVKYLFKRQRERIRTKYVKSNRQDDAEVSGSGI